MVGGGGAAIETLHYLFLINLVKSWICEKNLHMLKPDQITDFWRERSREMIWSNRAAIHIEKPQKH